MFPKEDSMKINVSNFVRNLSPEKFKAYGVDDMAYIRSAKLDDDSGSEVFIVFAADGSQISIMESYETAMAAIHINDLAPMTVN